MSFRRLLRGPTLKTPLKTPLKIAIMGGGVNTSADGHPVEKPESKRKSRTAMNGTGRVFGPHDRKLIILSHRHFQDYTPKTPLKTPLKSRARLSFSAPELVRDDTRFIFRRSLLYADNQKALNVSAKGL